MMTCSKFNFAVIHIPKNAGSTIRDQVEPFDDYDGFFRGTKDHPELGLYNSSHVPLMHLREHWPEVFAVLSGLETYAMVRDPVSRFSSALAQRARQIHKVQPDEMDAATIQGEIDVIINELETHRTFPTHKFVHFARQTDYLDLDGARFVKHIYPIERIGALIAKLEVHMGQPLIREFQANKTVTFRYPALKKALLAAKGVAKKALPIGPYNKLRDLGIRTMTEAGASAMNDAVAGEAVQAFIKDYYADDLAHYAAARAAFEPAA